MTLRLYLDEDVSPQVARLLRERGYDVIAAHEIGAIRLPDDEHLRRATAAGRVLFSYNHHDYGRIAKDWTNLDRHHAGILLSYQQYDRDEVGTLAQRLGGWIDEMRDFDATEALLVLRAH